MHRLNKILNSKLSIRYGKMITSFDQFYVVMNERTASNIILDPTRYNLGTTKEMMLL